MTLVSFCKDKTTSTAQNKLKEIDFVIRKPIFRDVKKKNYAPPDVAEIFSLRHTTARNVQNMNPVQFCMGFIFCNFTAKRKFMQKELSHPIVKITHSVCYMYGVRKKRQMMLLNFLIIFLISDAQPDFSGHFNQDFSHIAQAR